MKATIIKLCFFKGLILVIWLSSNNLYAQSFSRFCDGTIAVEYKGNSGKAQWSTGNTRILEKLDGYKIKTTAPGLDSYGGWSDRSKVKATGYFYTKKIRDRWWLVDPKGYRFIHVAINHVRPEWKAAYEALLVKFGTKEKWAGETSKTFFENGFNGAGSSSSDSLLRSTPQPLVYTRSLNFIGSFADAKKLTYATAGHTGFFNNCIPVFHPEFEAWCDVKARELAKVENDPYFLGFFSDNELQCPVDLLERNLSLDKNNPNLKYGHEAAVAWLLSRRGNTDTTNITRRERIEFISFLFERYYSLVRQATRRYAPNHLYLGSRLNQSTQCDNPFFMKMIGKYVDVISLNYYGVWGPNLDQMSRWEEWSGRPVIITEWYAKAEETDLANTKGAGWLVHTQNDRAAFYQHYVLGLLESRSCVGWHWFKYQDDPRESKALDSAGGVNKGMFTIGFEPYKPLLDAARAVNKEAYPLTEFFDSRK